MLFLGIYVLGALVIDLFFPLLDETSRLLGYIDTFVCFIFFGDFVSNLIRAKSKLAYLKWGWIDLASSIPTVEVLRWGRLARVVRVIRVLRTLRSARLIFHYLFANRTKGVFTTVAMLSFALLVFSSIAILSVEVGADVNITSAEEALWWSFVTITTVGYGDRYPVTTEGRIIAAALMTAGVGLFGTFTAYVASLFLEQEEEKQEDTSQVILQQLDDLSNEVKQLRDEIAKKATDLEQQKP